MCGHTRLFSASLLIAVTMSVGSNAALVEQSQSAEQDPLLGLWQLDLAKSRYTPGPPPRSETRTYVRDKAGVSGTIRRVRDNGREEVIEYRADFDHEFPVMGTEAYDTIKFKRIDARTAEAVLSHAGRVYGTARRTISQDGRTLTIAFRQEDRGVFVSHVAVYQKR